MSRRDKLLRRFLARPVDFRFDEMSKLLKDLGYREIRAGKTAGSRAAFVSRSGGHIIRLHKPHSGKHMKEYQMKLVEEALRARGAIE